MHTIPSEEKWTKKLEINGLKIRYEHKSGVFQLLFSYSYIGFLRSIAIITVSEEKYKELRRIICGDDDICCDDENKTIYTRENSQLWLSQLSKVSAKKLLRPEVVRIITDFNLIEHEISYKTNKLSSRSSESSNGLFAPKISKEKFATNKMKQHIQFEMSVPDTSYGLFLRKVYEEDDRLVVILEIERDGRGFSTEQEMSLSLIINLEKSTQKLPVTYFVVEDIQYNPDSSPWWLEGLNHVQSDKSITISNRATCLYDGKLMIPCRLGEGHGYEISNGCATEATVEIENATIDNTLRK